jgi:RimJ/RimL family protein N-acetyltransferase
MFQKKLYFNSLGQPIGKPVPNWKDAKMPTGEPLEGKTCRLELLGCQHVPDLWEANSIDKAKKNISYLPYGPFNDISEYKAWVSSVAGKPDPMFFAIIDVKTNKPVGVASYMGIRPELGSIEIGHLNFSPLMQRTIISSEAFIMMARNAFLLGNRTLVWRCHSLNSASVNAAKRYGFQYECFFQNYSVMKNRSRNTSWLSIIEEEWSSVDEVYTRWLELALAGNHKSLSVMIADLNEKKGGCHLL